jgi:spore germination protein KB
MIQKKEYKLGKREIISLLLPVIGIKFADMTPTLLFDETETASWMAILVSALCFLLSFLVFLSVMKRYPDKGLIDVFAMIFGKPLGFMVGLILFLFFLIGTAVDTRSYVNIISTLYFPKTPLLALYILLFIVCVFLAKRGLEGITRTSFVFLFMIKGGLLLLIILLWDRLEFSYLFPIFGRTWENIFITGFKFMPLFVEIMALAVFMTFFRDFSTYKKSSLISFGIVCFELVTFFLFYIMLYDVPLVTEITYLFHETTRNVSAGRFLANPETIFLPIWLLSTFIRFSFYLYITTALFSYLFNIKKVEPLLIPFAALLIGLGMLPENPVESEYSIRENVIFRFGSFYFFFLPFVMWIFAKRKEGKS